MIADSYHQSKFECASIFVMTRILNKPPALLASPWSAQMIRGWNCMDASVLVLVGLMGDTTVHRI